MFISVFCCNIRSVNAHFDEFILYIKSEKKYSNLDVIVFTETWHTADNCNYKIPGYKLYVSTHKRNQNDGIMVFIKEKFSIEMYEYNYEMANFIKLKLSVNDIQFNILCVYRSPSGDIDLFLSSFDSILTADRKLSGYYMIIGDLNINIVGTKQINNDYLDMLSEYGFRSFINVYTRTPVGCAHSCLDHIFIKYNNCIDNRIEAGVIQTNISDHYSVIMALELKNKLLSHNNNVYKTINYNKLNVLLKLESWSELYYNINVNKCFDIFIHTILHAINSSTTFKKANAKNKHIQEWMTMGLLCSVRKKQALSLKVKKHPNNDKLRSYYVKYKNIFTSILRITKNNFYKKKFNDISYSPKLTWKLITELTLSKNKNSNHIKSLMHNNEHIIPSEDPVRASNVFNMFFTNIGINLANKIKNSNQHFVETNTDVDFDMYFNEEINKPEIIKIINNLKDDTAAGFDGISVKTIKSIAVNIIEPLIYIYNLSISKCTFPDKLKIAIIKPLFKHGDATNINNYRPISMISNFAKILEKIIKLRLVVYLEKNKLLSKNQFGFRPGLSTENALYSASNFIYNALDSSKKTMAIFLDLAKAFDTVNHNELCNILPSFGLKNNSFKWFKNYLENRKQLVQINDSKGDEMKIQCGVPQGSVLGPILFILYINSICDLKIDGQIVTYADDTCLLFSGDSWDEVRSIATKEFKKVIKYLNHRQLSINYQKTNYINFSINKDQNLYDELKICFCENEDSCNTTFCQTIYKVSSIRYLGITFDKHMKWKLHANNIIMRMRTLTFSFSKLRNYLPVQTMRIIYLSLFQSIFQYGLLVWGGLNECAVRPLKILQRKIIRICLCKNNLVGSTGENFKLFRVLPFESVYKKVTILYVIQNYETFVDMEIIGKKREVRAFDVNIIYYKKAFGQKFINYLGPKYFNLMPLNLKKLIFTNTGNLKIASIKEQIDLWLFSLLSV